MGMDFPIQKICQRTKYLSCSLFDRNIHRGGGGQDQNSDMEIQEEYVLKYKAMLNKDVLNFYSSLALISTNRRGPPPFNSRFLHNYVLPVLLVVEIEQD